MSITALRLLLALGAVPSPDPQPESLEPKPPWKDDPPEPLPLPIDRLAHAAYDPFPPPQIDHVRGRVVTVASGPNRKQRRAR